MITARQEPRPTSARDFKILVLLPSLALLRQTLHEWLHETSLPSLPYLCVCSDPSVKDDLDAIATPQSDLDFPVTTDRGSVREFLDAPFAGVKVIFSTYQSARVVGERQSQKLASWVDLQRQIKRSGKLIAKRVNRLEKLGFVWSPHHAAWEEKYAELREYWEKFGYCRLSQTDARRFRLRAL